MIYCTQKRRNRTFVKKILLYFFAFIFICFILPALLTKHDISTSVDEIEEKTTIESVTKETKYDYSNYGTIKLLHQATGEVEELELDTYLLRCSFSRNASNL